jgi:hypothetical protein
MDCEGRPDVKEGTARCLDIARAVRISELRPAARRILKILIFLMNIKSLLFLYSSLLTRKTIKSSSRQPLCIVGTL